MQEKVDEFEDQEKQHVSQLRKVKNSCANAKLSSCYWKDKDAAMFGDWLTVLSSANQII